MRLFSEREGISVRTIIQTKGADKVLRDRLWNLLTKYYFKRIQTDTYSRYGRLSGGDSSFFDDLWDRILKLPISDRPENWFTLEGGMRKYFLQCEWFTVYNFVEYFVNNYWNQSNSHKFEVMKGCNEVLEEEASAYTFRDGVIVRKISEQELGTIENALSNTSKIDTVNTHLKTALRMATERKTPDHRNSIKESISAVEALCKLIAGKDKATLTSALDEIEEKNTIKLHPALKKAYSTLYGYTNDAEGIRHALLEESKLDFEDSMFMLSSCSAFISYLFAKCSKIGIKLQ